MHQLVYISTMRREIGEEELRTILETSIRNNAAVGITGLLLVGGNRFLQALEGPTQAVLDTFDRIKRDERHFAFVTLSSQSTSQRAFGDWAMAFEHPAALAGGGVAEMVEELTNDLSDLNLQAQLRGFARLHSAA